MQRKCIQTVQGHANARIQSKAKQYNQRQTPTGSRKTGPDRLGPVIITEGPIENYASCFRLLFVPPCSPFPRYTRLIRPPPPSPWPGRVQAVDVFLTCFRKHIFCLNTVRSGDCAHCLHEAASPPPRRQAAVRRSEVPIACTHGQLPDNYRETLDRSRSPKHKKTDHMHETCPLCIFHFG